jgi:prepilin-type N-terminal cleavage/methylation domain-containing protein
MTQRRQARRPGFTLLEMVLAMAIGVVLMLGLYITLDMFFKSAESGRTNIDQAQVTQAVCKKFTADITCHLPVLPNPTGSSSSSTTSTTSTTGSSSSTTGAMGTASTTTTTGPFPYNLGVQGGTDYCSIYIGRVPRSNFQVDTSTSNSNNSQNTQPTDSDLRRIDYWYVYDPDNSGLARQEVVMVTNQDDINSLPPGIADETSYIFAKEVMAVTFEYFDGTTWQSSWDGTVLGSDGVTPLGPPLAIAITISVGRSDVKTTDVSDPSVLTTRHVVHIPTAVVNPSTAPQTSGGG